MNMIESIPEHTHDTPGRVRDPTNTRRAHLDRIRSKLTTYQRDFRTLKEATTMLELAMWSAKMNESTHINPSSSEKRSKKMMIDASGFRTQCRISCGADIVIQHMLPYILPAN